MLLHTIYVLREGAMHTRDVYATKYTILYLVCVCVFVCCFVHYSISIGKVHLRNVHDHVRTLGSTFSSRKGNIVLQKNTIKDIMWYVTHTGVVVNVCNFIYAVR